MKLGEFVKKNGAWIAFILLALLMGALTEGAFFSPRNITNLFRQSAISGILAAGMTLVILTGGIDLSVGSIVAVAGIAAGVSQLHWGWSESMGWGTLGSLSIAVGAGLILGAINGALIVSLRIPPFVITLGMMVVARGLALIASDGSGIAPLGEGLRFLGEDYLAGGVGFVPFALMGLAAWGLRSRVHRTEYIGPLLVVLFAAVSFVSYKGLPVPVLFLGCALLVTAALLSRTVLGRSIVAIGSNEQAAYWAGVPIGRVKCFVYAAMGAFSGLAGALLAARLNSAVPTAGQLFELDAIAAVVIGGTSLKGGSGSVAGALAGALTIATLNNGMDLLAVPSFYQMIFKGVIIIGAVAVDRGDRLGRA